LDNPHDQRFCLLHGCHQVTNQLTNFINSNEFYNFYYFENGNILAG
jgi:hypothetical protein